VEVFGVLFARRISTVPTKPVCQKCDDQDDIQEYLLELAPGRVSIHVRHPNKGYDG
jgi:hypothetical protein